MLKNVVFDFGGVMVDYDPQGYLAERFLNKPLEDFLYERIFGSETWQELDAGLITLSKATQLMLAECGSRRYEGQMVLDDWRDLLTTKKPVVRLAEELKRNGAGLYYLSNISEDILRMFEQKKKFMKLFDGGVASCNEKLLKPDPRIFKCLMERYELNPAETVFIDDNRENIAAAEALGFTAILYRNAKDLRATLQFLGFSLKTTSSHRAKLKPAASHKKDTKVKAVVKMTPAPSKAEDSKQTDIPL